ncbi:MAG: hypothetical protein ACRYFR_16170 [Janthinobacterium lividum]
MATSAYQKQYKTRGKKARAAVARADRDTRKRLGKVAAAHQRLNDALARLARLNQVYGTAYPELTDLSTGFDDYSAGAAQLVGAYAAVEALPALAPVPDVAGGLALAGEAIFGEVVTAAPPAPLRLTGAVLHGTNPADGGNTVLTGQVTATGGTGAVAVHSHHRQLRGRGHAPHRRGVQLCLGHPLRGGGRAAVPGRGGGAAQPVRGGLLHGGISALLRREKAGSWQQGPAFYFKRHRRAQRATFFTPSRKLRALISITYEIASLDDPPVALTLCAQQTDKTDTLVCCSITGIVQVFMSVGIQKAAAQRDEVSII